MKNLARRALLNLAKVTQPHLSRIIGANRPQNIDWRLDPNPRPKRLPFDESQRGISPGISELNPITYTDVRRPFRILALDGGGVRGILTLALLIRIVERDPTFLDQVDLIAGTSAGGILALLLASG
jgi:Patatin-like phospholipase